MSITLANIGNIDSPMFRSAIYEHYAKVNALVHSGVATYATAQELGINPGSQSRVIEIPILQNPSADSYTELTDTNTSTTATAITAIPQIARNLYRAKAWGANTLAREFLQTDPLSAIARVMANFWAELEHKAMLSILAGLFADDGGATSQITGRYLDSTAVGVVTEAIVRAGLARMGDQFGRIKLMLVHPDVYAILDQAEAFHQVPDTDLSTYTALRGTNIRVVVDSTMPRHNLSVPNDVGANNSTIYYFGEGAFTVCHHYHYLKGLEVPSTGGYEIHERRGFMVHPNGLSWQSSAPSGAAGQNLSPSNAQLATKGNWLLAGDIDNLLIVRQDVAVSV